MAIVTVDPSKLHEPLHDDVFELTKHGKLGFAKQCVSYGVAGDHVGHRQRIGEVAER